MNELKVIGRNDLTLDVIEKFAERVDKGLPPEDVAAVMGVLRPAYLHWMREGKAQIAAFHDGSASELGMCGQFVARVEQAETELRARLVEVVLNRGTPKLIAKLFPDLTVAPRPAASVDETAPEPRVTQRQLDIMRHSTGGKLRAVRNYSISPPGHEWHDDWTELVRMGLAGEGEPPDCSEAGQRKGTVYHVTEAGFRMTYGDVRKPKRGSKR